MNKRRRFIAKRRRRVARLEQRRDSFLPSPDLRLSLRQASVLAQLEQLRERGYGDFRTLLNINEGRVFRGGWPGGGKGAGFVR